MYLTLKQQVKHLSREEFRNLKYLSHIAKNLTNETIYNIRQYYFKNKKYLSYNENYKMLKNSENYKKLNSNMAQQILKEVEGSFKSFFALLKKTKNKDYDYKKVKIPKYLKRDGYYTLVIAMIRIKDNKLVIPYSNSFKKRHIPIEITIPNILKDKNIKEIRIIPKHNARYFEIQYTYEVKEQENNKLDNTKALSIDIGINNIMTCVTNEGRSFIIDGRKLKSINQWYNKRNSKLQGYKDIRGLTSMTKLQSNLLRRRNNKVNDYIHKSCKTVISYCIANNIKNIVIGCNSDIQRDSNIGRVNNQTFCFLPLGRIKDNLVYRCKKVGMNLIIQEESYTSKASFFDRDDIPSYNDIIKDNNIMKEIKFNGKRIKRGLYKTKKGLIINADINGALNILRKSKVVSLETLYNRGVVDTPMRIRIA